MGLFTLLFLTGCNHVKVTQEMYDELLLENEFGFESVNVYWEKISTND